MDKNDFGAECYIIVQYHNPASALILNHREQSHVKICISDEKILSSREAFIGTMIKGLEMIWDRMNDVEETP